MLNESNEQTKTASQSLFVSDPSRATETDRGAVGMGWEWESYLSYGNSHRFSHGNSHRFSHGNSMGYILYGKTEQLHRIIHTPESKFKFRGPLTYVSTMFYDIVVA